MITRLLSFATVCALAGTVNAQNLTGLMTKGPSASVNRAGQYYSNPGAKTAAMTGPCTDTVLYIDYKIYFKSSTNQYLVLPTVPTGTGNIAGAFTYLNTGTVTVSGLGFAGYRGIGATSPSVTARAYLYNVNATYQPTTVIDSVTIPTGNGFQYRYASLISPKVVTGNYAVVVKNMGVSMNDTLKVACSGAQTSAAATDKFGEGLGSFKYAGTWYSANTLFGSTNDYEPACVPVISYSIAANFSTPATVCVNNAVTFTNTSTNQGVINSPFYNLGPFAQRWAVTSSTVLAGVDSAYTWIYGDGLKDYKTQATHNHTYTTTGTKKDTLITFMNGFSGTYCTDMHASTITVNSCPLGVNELSGPDAVKVFPNPSNTGRVNVTNLAENTDIELYNMIGQAVYHEKVSGSATVDVSQLAKGSYFFKITAPNEKTKMVKLILN